MSVIDRKMLKTMEEKREVTKDELKAIEISILLNLDSFCRKENIRYFLASGSLIGALRHKGFIPWDDDIDVMMPRPEFEKFIQCYHSDTYQLYYPGLRGYYQSIAKLAHKETMLIQRVPLSENPIGIHIDILPLDGEPSDMNLFVDHVSELINLYKDSFFWRKERFNIHPRYKGLKAALRYYLKRKRICKWSFGMFIEKINEIVNKYNYNDSDYVGYITMSRYKYKQRHRKSLFNEITYVEFEGYQFPAPAGYDEYLKNLFGNYMALPPAEKRVSGHVWKAYWKSK